jgi:hypothetical protein
VGVEKLRPHVRARIDQYAGRSWASRVALDED